MLKGKLKSFIVLLLLAMLVFPVSATATEYSLDSFEKAFIYVLERYVDELSAEQLEEMAIKGMLRQLDNYSDYYSIEEYEDFQMGLDGNFGGVGMKIEKLGDYVTVIAPLPGTPAEKAGIQAGDRIIKVNNEDVVGVTLQKAVELIRGEPGTSVKLTVVRDGTEPLIFTIIRELIEIKVVEWKMLDKKIGYVQLSGFSEESPGKFHLAVASLKEEGVKALILDLRNNPGGYLNAALSITSALVDTGKDIVHVVSRFEGDNTYYSTTRDLGLPLVILINGGSASASEIVAGAVQDHKSGTLVGTTSFGKATVQNVHEFSDGTAIKLTSAQYLTPLKREINGVGIVPDVIIEDSAEQLVRAQQILLEEIGVYADSIRFSLGKYEIKFNDDILEFNNAPYLSVGSVMVPIREFAEILRAVVEYDENEEKISIISGRNRLDVFINSDRAVMNGEERKMPAGVVRRDGIAFMPVRFFLESFGGTVSWDNGSIVVEMY